MQNCKRRQVWCPHCNNYRVTPGRKCGNCYKNVKKEEGVKKRENKVKYIYYN